MVYVVVAVLLIFVIVFRLTRARDVRKNADSEGDEALASEMADLVVAGRE